MISNAAIELFDTKDDGRLRGKLFGTLKGKMVKLICFINCVLMITILSKINYRRQQKSFCACNIQFSWGFVRKKCQCRSSTKRPKYYIINFNFVSIYTQLSKLNVYFISKIDLINIS